QRVHLGAEGSSIAAAEIVALGVSPMGPPQSIACCAGWVTARSTSRQPIVIATTSRAPTMTGGAGDATPKALQAKPIANASARPRRSFMAVSERGGVPVLQDVAGNNKAERNRHEHERADQAGRCGPGEGEVPATCADR